MSAWKKTTSERFILIHLSSTTTSEILLLDADLPEPVPQVFAPRRKDHEYGVDHYKQHFYIRSNKEGKNFGLYKIEDSQGCSDFADESQWALLIATKNGRYAGRIQFIPRLAGGRRTQ